MKKKLVFLLLALAGTALAKDNVGSKRNSSGLKSVAAGCAASTAKTELSLNNVRTVILMNGDMWWDAMAGQGPQYEIPKGSGKHSLYAGALWMGGKDASGNLKLAAQTYRQGGSDFWPGPLDTMTASVSPQVCLQYDRHWKVTFDQIADHKAWVLGQGPAGYNENSVPDVIKTWPGTGDASERQAKYLAPYVDVDGDMQYDYHYDYINHNQLYTTPPCGDYIFGDQCIYWIFNDVGNIHNETGGAPIGLEIHAQAFAFTSNDEINNMTFYNYKIINRSSATLSENYFGAWVDADLGYYRDDYVGCDVKRGLGYCYNGDADDEGPTGYGTTPPAVGVDFFQGPLADSLDQVDNNRNCIVDEPGEQIIMSRFVFYVNTSDPVNGNPFSAEHYYNYLRGIWKNGQQMTYGGNGRGGGNNATPIPCLFMFPGNTDHDWEWGTGGDCASNNHAAAQADWDEYIAGNPVEDRRFLHSAGPFTLKPGNVNYISTGVVWARAAQGGPLASVAQLQLVDDKAQALFDNCFAVPNGPDAPDVTLRELDKEIILTLSNSPSSNNYKEGYQERDPDIYLSLYDTLYKFQGYQIFQLKDQTVSSNDLHDADKARLVAQVDIKDDVAQIVNHYRDNTIGAYISVMEVNGENKGIRHSFRILTDLFATGDNRLINHKNYFYMAIAYGFNHSEVAVDPYPDTLDGKRKPYLPGRRNVKVYTAIPHIPSPENYGQVLSSIYGNGPKLRRVEGSGDGYLINYNTTDVSTSDFSTIRLTMDLTSETVNEILDANSGYRSLHPEYEGGRGPVNVKVIDPVKVPKADFLLWLENTDNTAHWHLKNMTTTDDKVADVTYSTVYEQVFPDWGLSVVLSKIADPLPPNDSTEDGHGFVEATMTFSDPNKVWLSGVPDQEGADSALDWVLSPGRDADHRDRGQNYEKVLGGIWAPYGVASYVRQNVPNAPAYDHNSILLNFVQNINNIDLVITRDKSKWSRCVVVEANSDINLAEGAAPKCTNRRSPSIDKEGVAATDTTPSSDPDAPNYISGWGMSWFPGYAIDVEKGERLNILFAEDSWLNGENGRDMKWNPTSSGFSVTGQPLLGGFHYIYIINSNRDANVINQMTSYDGCAQIKEYFNSGLAVNKQRIYKNCTWVNFPLLAPGYSFENGMIPPCDVKVRLRVARPYSNYGTGTPVASGDLQPNQTYVVYDGKITYNAVAYSAGQTFTTDNSNFAYTVNASPGTVLSSNGNNGYPLYSFKTDEIANDKNNVEAAKNALDLINIVPNPYYAFSAYEGTLVAGVTVQPQLDNRVKIVNLPPRSTISIYTVNGILVRKFDRDVAADNSYGTDTRGKNFETTQDWDLKNHKNVPIASGLYLVHVEAKDKNGELIGERTLKWFGVIRPIDLDSF